MTELKDSDSFKQLSAGTRQLLENILSQIDHFYSLPETASEKEAVRVAILYDLDSLQNSAKYALDRIVAPRITGFLSFEGFAKDAPYADKRLEALEQLATNHIEDAVCMLADIYSGYGFHTDVFLRKTGKASILYEKAAKSSDTYFAGYANFRLAQIYADWSGDNGLSPHAEMAKLCAQKSAHGLGSPYGLYLLADWHFRGVILDKNWVQSFNLCKQAYDIVDKPDWDHLPIKADILYKLGLMKFYGDGGERSETDGLALITRARELGHQESADFLNRSARNDNREGAFNPMQPFASQVSKKQFNIKSKRDLEKVLRPLQALIGCKPVKDKISALSSLAYINALRDQKNIGSVSVSMHAFFTGAPGTGKTTVARLYGDILYNLGLLSSGHVTEVSRADLIGEYIGQTAPKVRDAVDRAMGGILFIDEAYSLIGDYGNDFGHEAMAELLLQMENRRHDFVVIMAGYEREMQTLLNANPGLRSRIPNMVDFPDYKAAELIAIFELLVKDARLKLGRGALQGLEKHLAGLDGESVRRFGNGRGIRNLYEESLLHQARRLAVTGKTSKAALLTLEESDIPIPGKPGTGVMRVVRDDQ